jgi:hypothetical protein
VVVASQSQSKKENDMNKSSVMKSFLKLNGGEYHKRDGKWYWKKNNEEHLVTSGFLLNYKPIVKIEEPKPEIKEEPKVEIKEEIKKPKPKKKVEVKKDENIQELHNGSKEEGL